MRMIAVDAMGGDYAPGEIVKGSVEAVLCDDIEVILVGSEKLIREELIKYSYPAAQISVVHAGESIGMDEHPARAVRRKTCCGSQIGKERAGCCLGFCRKYRCSDGCVAF